MEKNQNAQCVTVMVAKGEQVENEKNLTNYFALTLALMSDLLDPYNFVSLCHSKVILGSLGNSFH